MIKIMNVWTWETCDVTYLNAFVIRDHIQLFFSPNFNLYLWHVLNLEFVLQKLSDVFIKRQIQAKTVTAVVAFVNF